MVLSSSSFPLVFDTMESLWRLPISNLCVRVICLSPHQPVSDSIFPFLWLSWRNSVYPGRGSCFVVDWLLTSTLFYRLSLKIFSHLVVDVFRPSGVCIYICKIFWLLVNFVLLFYLTLQRRISYHIIHCPRFSLLSHLLCYDNFPNM